MIDNIKVQATIVSVTCCITVMTNTIVVLMGSTPEECLEEW